MSGAATPTAVEPPPLDDCDVEPRTPMKRLGSTRKLAAFNNIRLQLAEQTRVLEARAEATAGVAGELHDYCRRRADLEHEYARALDKLARAAAQKHDAHKHKREQWTLTGAFACWQAALEHTRALSRDHSALGELYGGPLAGRLARAGEDALRLHRKCRDVLAERHDELGAALSAAHAAHKAHAAAAADWRAAALKLRHVYDQRERLAAHDPPRHKKLKALDKELDKRRARHSEARARALRARADYVLSLEGANATLQRYYLDDIADIILCMEVGFEAVVGRCVRTAGEAEQARAAACGAAGGALRAHALLLHAHSDHERLLHAHAATFALPRPLLYHDAPPAHQDAEMRDLVGDAAEPDDAASAHVAHELAQRLAQLDAAARDLRAQCTEHAKTLDAAEAELVKQMEGSDAVWDVSGMFGATGSAAPPPGPAPPSEDQEDYYLAKFRSYVSCAGRLARLESKASGVRTRLVGGAAGAALAPPPRRGGPRARRGLFAAPLDERLPLVLTSCVRVIAEYGLRHQGIFRVSGSQVEMQALRAAFERGEDPLAHVRDASDINSVCGLLKLFLREVRPPLLPPQLQERLLRVAALPDDDSFVRRLRATLAALPTPALLVLRYLFAFLAHLADHSEHNMMDAWNLAICLGPTLLPAWGEGGAQLTAQNLVNELVKRIILHHQDVFPQDIAPYALYTRFSEATENNDGVDDADSAAPNEQLESEGGSDVDNDGQADGEHADQLSLYDVDDDDTDDISEEDGESGEWGDRDSGDYRRSGSGERPVAASGPAAGPASEPAAGPVAEPAPPGGVGVPGPASLQEDGACVRLDTTPDLVLDLPAAPLAAPSAPSAPLAPIAPTAPPAPPASHADVDTADTFVHNRDTLKKRAPRRSGSAEGSEGAEGAEEGSPVPARNTARVCAKFAELTLTGGSLKPALAAKPALLRRPTPHPHARPPPTD